MRSRWFLVLLVMMTVIAGVYLITGTTTKSSGTLTTSDDSQTGQVRVTTDGDVIYLSNETVPGVTSDGAEFEEANAGSDSTQLKRNSLLDDTVGSVINLKPDRYAENIGQVFRAVLNLVLILSILLVFGYIVMAAIKWITSGGDKAKTDLARQMMISAVIGLIIVVSSYAVINLVVRFIGFDSVDELFDLVQPISTYEKSATASATPNLSPTPSVSPE